MPDGLLVRALRYAIERHRLLIQLRVASLVDALTGLYNRRAFLTLAEQHARYATRQQQVFVLFFLDLDGLKRINDTYGHTVGDQALCDMADILREVFRCSDIIARLSGDEFAVLAPDASRSSAEGVLTRLRRHVERYNASNDRRYTLSFSMGSACYDPESPQTIETLLTQADTAMYVQKRRKANEVSTQDTTI